MFGFLIAVAILSLQIRYGVVTEHGIRGSWLSLLWPYAAAFGFVYLAQVVATIRKIQEEMESEIGSLKAALSQLGAKLDRLLPRLRFQGLGSAVKHRPNTTLHNIIVGNENHAIVNSATNVRATVSYQYGDGQPFTFGGAWVVVPTNDEVLAVSIEGGKFQRFVFLLQHETKFFCPELMGGCINAGMELQPGVWSITASFLADNCDPLDGHCKYRLAEDGQLTPERPWSFRFS